MTIGILGALDVEVAVLVEQMEVSGKTEALGTTFYSGTLAGCSAVVAVMGIGKINAALCTNYIIEHMGAQCVINVGIAGAVGEGLGVMDVVVSNEVLFHDTDAFMSNYFPFRQSFEADPCLVAVAMKACEDLVGEKGHRFTAGRIATGDQFVASQEVKNSIIERFNPLCVEMEGAAVGQVAYIWDIPFVVIRTMSDSADDEADATYDNFMEEAANRSAAIVIAMAEAVASL